MAKILVVDDEQNIREIFSHVLTNDGHEVELAVDGMDAVRMLRSTSFDVVVSDINMPNLSGSELHEFIREAKSDIQVILITGDPSVETATAALRDQAFDYLVKPVKGTDLCQTVKKAITLKKLRDEKNRVDEENQRIRKHLEKLVQERTAELAQTNQSLLIEIRERVKAQDGLQESLERLKENLNETTHALAMAIEKRDPYTAGHQEHVAKLAVAIGKQMSLSQEVVDTIHTAAVIHDVGKNSIPAEILSKPGVLDDEEMALIRKHSRIGYEIVSSIHFPGPVAQCVRQHHERWNGTGYPDGLKGESILLEARIIAVADVVEAMAHHRPYRPALGLTAALSHVTGNKLTLYGPDVVEACQTVFEGGFTFQKG